jgi:AP-3 complex subunit beta
VKKLV